MLSNITWDCWPPIEQSPGIPTENNFGRHLRIIFLLNYIEKLSFEPFEGRINVSGRVLNWKSEDDENTSKCTKSEDPIFSSNDTTSQLALKNLLMLMAFVPISMFMPVYLVKNPGANFSFERITRHFYVGKLMKNITVQNYIRLSLALVVISWFLEDNNKEEFMSMITHWFSSGFGIYLFCFLIDHEWFFFELSFLNL